MKQAAAVQKATLEAVTKDAEANAAMLNGKISQLNTELAGAKTAVADWKREADKSKADAEKSRASTEDALRDKAAAQEARVLAEKDSKTALEAKAKAEAERLEIEAGKGKISSLEAIVAEREIALATL